MGIDPARVGEEVEFADTAGKMASQLGASVVGLLVGGASRHLAVAAAVAGLIR